MQFDEAFEKLIGHEGGYVDDPRDPGGETKFGITKRTYPNLNIKALTLAEAKAIYRRDYWARVQAELLPAGIRFDAFDMAVNSGVTAAIKLLQTTVCVEADGIIGPQTMTAIRAMPAIRFVAHFNARRLLFMTDLKNWPAHGKGWARRVAENILTGV